MPEQAKHPAPARAIIDTLAGGGTFVDEGVFTLDRARALEKLAAYRMADPDAWLFLLVQLGNLLSARSIEITCGPESCEVFLAGVLVPDEWLSDPLGGILRDSGSASEGRRLGRARQRLSVTFAHVSEFDPELLEIQCVPPEGRSSRVRRLRGENETFESDLEPTGPTGTRVRVVYAGSIDGGRAMRQIDTLRKRCRYGRIDVRVGGQYASHGWRRVLESGEDLLAPVEITGADGTEIGVAGVRPDRSLPPGVVFQMDGVVVETVARPGSIRGFVALVEDDLNLDLSQGKVVRDSRFDEVMRAIDQAHEKVRSAREARAEARHPTPPDTPRTTAIEYDAEPRPEAGNEVRAGKPVMMLGLVVGVVGSIIGLMTGHWMITIGAMMACLFIVVFGSRETIE